MLIVVFSQRETAAADAILYEWQKHYTAKRCLASHTKNGTQCSCDIRVSLNSLVLVLFPTHHNRTPLGSCSVSPRAPLTLPTRETTDTSSSLLPRCHLERQIWCQCVFWRSWRQCFLHYLSSLALCPGFVVFAFDRADQRAVASSLPVSLPLAFHIVSTRQLLENIWSRDERKMFRENENFNNVVLAWTVSQHF